MLVNQCEVPTCPRREVECVAAPRVPHAAGWDGRSQAFPDFNQHHPLSETLMSAPDGSEFQSTHPGNGNSDSTYLSGFLQDYLKYRIESP